jgi:hypothetical protein
MERFEQMPHVQFQAADCAPRIFAPELILAYNWPIQLNGGSA